MQTSFFDYALQYQGGKKSTKFLTEMKELIPFETIESLLIEKGIYKPNKGKQGKFSTPEKFLLVLLFYKIGMVYHLQWQKSSTMTKHLESFFSNAKVRIRIEKEGK